MSPAIHRPPARLPGNRRDDAARPTLQEVLRRALSAVVVLAVLLAGCMLTLLGTLALRSHAAANLQLLARSAAYTVEAALVFHDAAATSDALALISSGEDVAEAWVFDSHGRLLVRWRRGDGSAWQRLRHASARLLLPPAVEAPVAHDGVEIGRVRLRGAGGGLGGFLFGGILAILACLMLSALAAAAAMQRVLRKILAPLRELAAVARAVRVERTLERRVPAARIAEFHQLGEDVNALLAELEARQDHLQRENAHLAHRALHDSLTGLANRALFEQRLARAVPAAAPGTRLAVLFLDADRFKQINDSLGHAAGDAVLVAAARRIRQQLRDQDLVARLGGDEFAVLIEGLHDARDARRIVDAIGAAMAEPVALAGGASVLASLSVGLAVFPDDARDAAGLLRAADAAMYRQKRARPEPAQPSPAQQPHQENPHGPPLPDA